MRRSSPWHGRGPVTEILEMEHGQYQAHSLSG
jgi:hypothetical protein